MSIYLIIEGRVDIYLENKSGKEKRGRDDYVFKEMTKGEYFGEFSFFSGKKRTASAKASSYCTLIKIKRSDFVESL